MSTFAKKSSQDRSLKNSIKISVKYGQFLTQALRTCVLATLKTKLHCHEFSTQKYKGTRLLFTIFFTEFCIVVQIWMYSYYRLHIFYGWTKPFHSILLFFSSFNKALEKSSSRPSKTVLFITF